MAIVSAQVAVSTTAAELTSGLTTAAGDSQSIAVQAPAAAILYVGPAGVTSTTGFPIAAGQTIALDLEYGERLYGILATGTGTAFTIRTSV
jgi:hypothetical protein